MVKIVQIRQFESFGKSISRIKVHKNCSGKSNIEAKLRFAKLATQQ